jgi:predicted ATPase/class 3 adenylate cyclase
MERLADQDPEEARALLDPVLERMMEAVHRYEGTVNQVMGDGIMALFGAPVAHEDHAVRACYAALRMQESIRRFGEENLRDQGAPIQIRVGLNSGEVVVRSIGSDLHMDYTAVGQTTHLAARMEQIASPGSILLTAESVKLAEGYVDLKALGPVPVKGVSTPVEVYEVTGAGPVRRRLQALAIRALSNFVGRDGEIDQLQHALQHAGAGRGQIVAVVGEPGVGKSRLFLEFTRSHRTRSWLVLESGSVSYGKVTPYLPIVDLLKGYFKIENRDDHEQVREEVREKLVTLDRALEASVPAFLTLLDVPDDSIEWNALDPRLRRQRTLDALKRLVLLESRVQPLLLVFEDLHWIDTETQTFLNGLVESLPTARILLLINYRPEYTHPWACKSYYSQLRIDPLLPPTAAELLRALLGSDPDLDPLKGLLIERTEGNPFFLEESIRALVETGVLVGERGAYRLAKALPSLQIPATAQAILAARIDRLSPENKRLLQTASVIGKDVSFTLLQAVADEAEEVLRPRLAELQSTEFLYEARLFPDLEYTFKHALTHEVTYASLLRERRHALHARIVEAIERLYADRLSEQVEHLAHHAVRGEVWDKAVMYLHEAGTKVSMRCANAEAIAYFTQGLDLVPRLPAVPERMRRELRLLLGLGPALAETKGFGAAEVGTTYARARALGEQVGEPIELFQALWGLWLHSAGGRGGYEAARRIAEELLALSTRLGDPALLLEAHHALCGNMLFLGDPQAARGHAERGMALYDREQHRSLAFLYGGHDPGVCCHMHDGLALWILGRPGAALQSSHEGVALARNLAHPFSVANALPFLGIVHQLRGDADATRELAASLLTLSREHGFQRHMLTGRILDASVQAKHGRDVAAIARLRQDIGEYRASGNEQYAPYFLLLLAAAHLAQGETDEGLGAIAEALRTADVTAARLWEAELHRLRGELLLARDRADASGAEAAFREAIAIARWQHARSWELRAATSHARLLSARGMRDEAWRVLAETYGWFTEGFDTADLKDAKTLLEELS